MATAELILYVFLCAYVGSVLTSVFLEALNVRYLRGSEHLVPGPLEGFIDREKLGLAREYTLERGRVQRLHAVTTDALLLAMVLLGAFHAADGLLLDLGCGPVFSGWAIVLGTGCVFLFAGLPFDWYSTFVVEAKFGFNRMTVNAWIWDQVKGVILSAVLVTMVLIPLLWVVGRFPDTWWLWGFAAVSAFELLLVVCYPVLIAPIFNRFDPLEDPSLAREVEDLVNRAGMKARGIFRMDAGTRSSHSNAYFTGFGRTKRVVLFDTLLESHPKSEILAVVAHELGHYKGRHVRWAFLLSESVMGAAFFFTYVIMGWDAFWSAFGLDAGRFHIGLMILAIFWSKLGIAFRPPTMAVSRMFERQADLYAAELLGTPEPMISALKRLARDNLANLFPHPVYVWFHYSHPPLCERIAALQEK
ncbi:MAG: M48 family metallopeptidase [Thermodesulfobacteriota bacterium]